MIASALRTTFAAPALLSFALVGCTGDPGPTPAATNVFATSDSVPAAAGIPTVEAPADDGIAGATVGAICDEDDIACQELFYQLEETLFLYEGGVANQLDAPTRACWQADGEAFRHTLAACGDNACRERALRERIASLHALQPDENRASLPHPEAPELIAVIGPEHDAGTPSDASPVPFEARGRLIHAAAHAEHMGIAVNSTGGEKHVFIFDMDIGSQPGHNEVLGLVGASPTAKVLVRGHRKMAPDGVANFDAASCRLVFQLP